MAWTDYGYQIPAGLPGGIYDLSDKQIATRQVDADTEVKPGMGVVVGATAGETVAAVSSGSAADDFEGVFVHGSKNLEYDVNGEAATGGYESIGVMQKGKIWVLIADTATTTYKNAAALITDGDNAGKFTDSGDTSETSVVALSDAIFTGVADADNGIAVIQLS